MGIKNCWLWNGERASDLFGWVKNTEAGKMMDQIDDIFQPLANDIRSWRFVQDIGKFSDETMKELEEAWASIPDKYRKRLRSILNFIIKKLPAQVSPQKILECMAILLKAMA